MHHLNVDNKTRLQVLRWRLNCIKVSVYFLWLIFVIYCYSIQTPEKLVVMSKINVIYSAVMLMIIKARLSPEVLRPWLGLEWRKPKFLTEKLFIVIFFFSPSMRMCQLSAQGWLVWDLLSTQALNQYIVFKQIKITMITITI